MADVISFEVHESHVLVFEVKGIRYIILMGGRGNGRSGTASRLCTTKLLGSGYTRGALMRAVKEDIRTSCWSEVVDRLTEAGIESGVIKLGDKMTTVRIVDNDMFVQIGQNSLKAHGFKSSSGSLKARLKSLAGYNFVWIEEGEEIGEAEFTTLDDSLRTTKGEITIVITLNTPPKNHWIIRKFFDPVPNPEAPGFFTPKLKEGLKDTLFIGGTYRENLPNLDTHTLQRYQGYKYTNPAYYWQVIEGLSPEEVRGKIYSGWQLIDAIPVGARLVKFGVDWGWYPDPLSVVALYYYNGGYIVDEVIHGTNVDDEALANAIKSVSGWEYVPAMCGADEPKSVETLRKYGIKAEIGVKGPGSVEYRIKATAAKKIWVTRRSENVWLGYENYHWAEDRDGNPKGEPDHYLSDTMDAVSYGVASINPIKHLMTKQVSLPRERTNPGL